MNNRLYTIQEVADILGVSTKTLRRWDQRGRFVPTRTAGNQRRYTQQQIQQFKVQSSKFKVNHSVSLRSAPEPASNAAGAFFKPETPKEFKPVQGLPSALSSLPSNSFLKHHFLLKHRDEIELGTDSGKFLSFMRPPPLKLNSEPSAKSSAKKVSAFKIGFMFAGLVLILSFAGAVLMTRYNLVAGLAQKKEQFAKLIANLPQISISLKPRDLSFAPQNNQAVLAAETGVSDLILNVNVPAFFSQSVGIGTTAVDPSAILDISAEDKGFLAPRMTTVQRDAITSPTAGLFVYNTDTNHYNMYNGTAWQGVFTSIGDSTLGEAFTKDGKEGNSLYFHGTGGGNTQITAGASSGTSNVLTFPDTTGTFITTGNLTAITKVGTVSTGVWNGTVLTVPYGGTGVSTLTGIVLGNGSGVMTGLTTSVGISGAISDETGTGALVFGTSPAITTSLTTASTTFALINTAATTVNFAGAATTLSVGAATGTTTINNATTAITGALTANGDVTLGDAITDNITFTGRVAQDSDLLPIGTTGTNDLGSSTLPWDNLYANNVIAGGTSGIFGWLQRNAQTLSPTNITDDFLLGGISTASAKFGILNIAGGNPTATMSSNLSLIVPTGNAPAATFNLLNNGTLNFQRSPGGDAGLATAMFVSNNGNIGIGTTAPGALLHVRKDVNDTVGDFTNGPQIMIDNPDAATDGGISAVRLMRASATKWAWVNDLQMNAGDDLTLWGQGGIRPITVKASSGNVGIGNTTPLTALDVTGSASLSADLSLRGAGTAHTFNILDNGTLNFQRSAGGDGGLATALFIQNNGNIGIGTTGPSGKLEVTDSSSDTISVLFKNTKTGAGTQTLYHELWANNEAGTIYKLDSGVELAKTIAYIASSALTRITTTVGSTDAFTIKNDGNVGIGNTTPLTALDVAGSASLSADLSLRGAGTAHTFNILDNGTLNFQRSPGGDAGLATALFIQNNGNVGIGNTAPGAMLSVGSSTPALISSAGLVTIANTTDSTSGSTGSINTLGGLGVTKDLAVDGGDMVTGATTFNLINTTATTLNIGGAATTLSIGAATGTVTLNNATTAITGALTANGDVTLGDAATDNITFTGRVAQDSDLIPIGTTGTNDLGSSSFPWDNLYADNIYSPSSGTSGYWQRNAQALSPTNITDDLLLGATSTASAKFGILNMAGGNPTATMSSNLSLIVPTGNAPAATFNLLNNGTLNIQRSPGGDAGLTTALFIQNNGNVGIGTTAPTNKLTVDLGAGQNATGVLLTSSGTEASLQLKNTGTGGKEWQALSTGGSAGAGQGKFQLYNSTDAVTPFIVTSAGSGVVGNVGLGGQTSPLATLDVTGSASLSANLSLKGAGTAHTFNILDNGTLNIQRSPGGDAGLATALFIQSNGSVGIGNTAPGAMLSVGSSTPALISSAGLLTVANTTDSTSGSTGSINTLGGLGVTKDLAVDGGDIVTGASTFNLLNATATTVNFAGAATTFTMGATTGTASIRNAAIHFPNATAVGIGMTNPLTALDVTGSASLSADLSLRGAGTAHLFNILQNGTLNFQRSAGGDAGLTSAIFIQGDGNVGIGTTAPAGKLDVRESGAKTDTSYGEYIANTATSTAIGAKNKYGLYVSSTGAWNTTGGYNYGLFVDATGGGTDAGAVENGDNGSVITGALKVGGVAADGPPNTNYALDIYGSTYVRSGNLEINGSGDLSMNSGTGKFVQTFTGTTTDAVAIVANSLTSGNALDVSSSSTAALTGDALVNLAVSGANAASSITRYALYAVNTATGTTSTNVGGYFSASGATNNYGLIVDSGNVGIGNTTPLTALDVTGSASLSADLSLRGAGTAHLFNILQNGTLNIQRSPGGDAGLATALFIQNNGSVGIGNTAPGAMLSVGSSTPALISSAGLVTIANTTDSTSGSTGSINTLGGLGVTKDLAVDGGDIVTGASTFNLINATATTVNFAGAATTLSIGAATGTVTLNNATTAITGALTANGDVTLGNAITDNITFTGRVALDSDLLPIGTTGTNDLGSSALPWDNLYADNIYSPSSGTSGYWQRRSNALSPENITDDFLLGATSTASAKFGILNMAGGNPTATMSSNLSLIVPTGNAPAATFNLLNNGTLNFQRSPGGDAGLATALFIQNNGNVGIGTTGPNHDLHIYQASGVSDLKIESDGDAANLYLDKVNSANDAKIIFQTAGSTNFEIGVDSTPADIFKIGRSNNNADVVVNTTGNLGIGTTGPGAKLEIYKSGSGATQLANFYDDTADGRPYITISDNSGEMAGDDGLLIGYDNTNNFASLHLAGEPFGGALVIANAGNVGIGNTTPLTALDVTGSASLSANLSLRGAGTAHTFNILDNGTLNFQRSPGGDAGLATALFIQSNGSVGIGTTAPESLLHIKGAGADLRVEGTSHGRLLLRDTGSTDDKEIYELFSNLDVLTFNLINNAESVRTELMRIDSSGLVGIGTTSPNNRLEVLSTTTPQFRVAYDTSNYLTQAVSNAGAVTLDATGTSAGFNFSDKVGIGKAPVAGQTLTVAGQTASGTVAIGVDVSDTFTAAANSDNLFPMNIGGGNVFASVTYTGLEVRGLSVGGASWTKTGTGTITNASALWLSVPTIGTNNYGIYQSGAGNNYFGGNVGIGNTTPLTALDVTGSASLSANLSLRGAGTAHTFNILDNGTLNFQRSPGGDAGLAANSVLFLGNNGNVGIGTTGPVRLLHIKSATTESSIIIENDAVQWKIGNYDYGTGLDSFFVYGGSSASDKLVINPAGNVGIGDTGPDYLLELYDATNTPAFALSDDDIAHGVTTLAETDVFGHLSSISTTVGGLQVTGLADATGIALGLKGVQSSNPTDTTPAISLIGAKANGTGVQDLAAAETVFQVANNDDAAALTILGDGKVGIGTATPTYQLQVGDSAVGTSFAGMHVVTGDGGFYLGTDDNNILFDAGRDGTYDLTILGSNKNVGIGNTTPLTALDVTGSASLSANLSLRGAGTAHTFNILDNGTLNFQRSPGGDAGLAALPVLYLGNNGNVGIGTTTPSEKLEVSGNIAIGSNLLKTTNLAIQEADSNFFEIRNAADNAYRRVRALQLRADTFGANTANPAFYLGEADGEYGIFYAHDTGGLDIEVARGQGAADPYFSMGGSQEFKFYNSGVMNLKSNALVIDSSGNVGINNSTPLTALDVTGSASLSANLSLRGAGTAHTFNILDNGTLNIQRSPGGDAGLAANSVLYLGSNGSVGIGITAPTSKLDVYDPTANTQIRIRSAGADSAPALQIANDVRTWQMTVAGGDADKFKLSDETAGLTRLTIDSSGLVGIRTTSPTLDLDIRSSAANSPAYLDVSNSDASKYLVLYSGHSGDNRGAIWWTSTETGLSLGPADSLTGSGFAEKLTILTGGNVGIGNTAPLTALDVTGSASLSANLSLKGAGTAHTFNILDNGTLNFQRSPGGDAGLASALLINSAGSVVFGNALLPAGDAAQDIGSGAKRVNMITARDLTLTNSITLDGGTVSLPNTTLFVPTIKGGSAVGSSLTLQSTSAVGTTDFINFKVGNNGATEAMRIIDSGNVGIGTTTPAEKLHLWEGSSGGTADGASLMVIEDNTNAYLTFLTPSANKAGILWGDEGSGVIGQIIYNHSDNHMEFTTNTAEQMRITSAGLVGIGTTAPLFKLDVQDSQTATAAAMIYNTSTGTDADGLAIKLGFTGAGTATNLFTSFLNGNGLVQGLIKSNASSGVTYQTNGVADFAEYFEKDQSQNIPFGSVVCFDGSGLAVACDNNSNKIVGVASEHPAFLGGDNLGDRSVPVGLVGQVKTRVSTANGEIKIGDPLTTSSTPGVAVKATQTGQILGKAIEGFNGSGEGSIRVSVNISWYNPSIYVSYDGTLAGMAETVTSIGDQLALQGLSLQDQIDQIASSSASINYVLATDPLFDSLNNKVANLQAKVDLLSSQAEQQASTSAFLMEIVNSQVLGASTSAVLDLGDVELNNAVISDSLNVLGRTTVTDLGVTGNINAGLLAIHGIDGEIGTLAGDLYLQKNGIGGVNILDGKVVIDTLGNMTVAGTVTADAVEANTYTVLGDQSIGSAAIPIGSTSIDILTSVASSSSKIFLTSTSLTDKQITVISKSDGRFKVAIPTTSTSPITFDWWIVGNK